MKNKIYLNKYNPFTHNHTIPMQEDFKNVSPDNSERISIKSVSDIVDKVPLEDIDNFITDLKGWYTMMKTIKTFDSVLWISKLVKWWVQTNYNEMLRVNDWKHDKNVNITLKQDKQSEK